MKCRKCNDKAVINMRQHKLALCETHFLEWIPEKTERFIRLYAMLQPEEKILVAVSGGKDSLALWEILTRFGYQADGLYINLGINEGLDYSDQSYDDCVIVHVHSKSKINHYKFERAISSDYSRVIQKNQPWKIKTMLGMRIDEKAYHEPDRD